jgi:RHS repeat-associated protein
VLVTISDKKIGVNDGTYDAGGVKLNSTPDDKIDFYTADVVTANDYYPFGMGMPGRKFDVGTSYRYGFNGKENDNEITSDYYDFGARIYDGRTGRFLSVDPLTKKFTYQSPYNYAENNPIRFIDIDGKGAGDPISYTTPNGGMIKLPTQSNVTYLGNLVSITVHDNNIEIKNPTINGKEISFAPGALNTFTYNKELYQAHFNIETGKFAGYYSQSNPEHYIMATKNTLPDWEVYDADKSSKRLQAGTALVLSPNPGTKVPWVAIGTLATAAVLAYNATANLLNEVVLTTPAITILDGFLKAEDASKNEKHGDGGRAKTKAEKQIEELAEKLKDATGRYKKQLEQKIKNITKDAAQKAKGNEHSRIGKR